MAFTITVPRLGWSMDEGTFGEWLKKDGDVIKRGDAVFVLEGEKSAQDIEAVDAGILRIPADAPRPGDTVRVGQVLAYLVEAGEAIPTGATAGHAVAAGASETAATVAPSSLTGTAQVGASVSGGEPATATIATTFALPAAGVASSPRARRAARELGIDCAALRGTGKTGRIRERDVLHAAGRSTRPICEQPAASLPSSPPVVEAVVQESKVSTHQVLSPVRRTIAARMAAGSSETAPVTLTTKCDATRLVALRAEVCQAASGGAGPGYNDFLLKLTVAALRQHPQLTQQWKDDALHVPEGMHIAIAVDTEAGLVAPVVRDVDRLTVKQIAERRMQLVEQARAGRLAAADLQGGVFTITNLGAFGIDAFTPIINLPQCAILGVGRIRKEPAVVGDAIVPRDLMTLSLTFDHRIVDGAPAARFLQTLAKSIEAPDPSLSS